MKPIDTSAFLRVLIVTALTSASFGCSTNPPLKQTSRSIASASCELPAHDEASARFILERPDLINKKIEARLNAVIEGYLMGEELKRDFDRMLRLNVTPSKIYTSETYARLLSLRTILEKVRGTLEDIFIVRIADELKRNPGKNREQLIEESMALVQAQLHQKLNSTEDSLYVRLALVDLAEDLSDLKTYYLTCQENAGNNGESEIRMEKRRALIRQLEKEVPLRGRAYEAWSPKAGDSHGIHVAQMVDRAYAGIQTELEEIHGPNRSPQKSGWIPSTGADGNIVGNGFPKGTWALTYDDGPGHTTAKVLDHLDSHGIKATFFVLSKHIAAKGPLQNLALRAKNEGHAMASHSYTHAQITKLGPVGRTKEIVTAVEVFKDILGVRSEYFRLPYGAGVGNTAIRQVIKDQKMIHVFWNVDTLDWQDKNPESIFKRTVDQMTARGKGVILFHDIHPQSVVASEMVMRYLNDNNLKPVTIPQIVKQMSDTP